MDACVTVFVLWVVACLVVTCVQNWEKSSAEARAAKAAADAKAAEEQFLREHPEAWLAKQRAGMEREKLQAHTQFVADESRRQDAGTVADIFWRIFR